MSLSVTYDGQSLNDFLGVGQNYNAFDSAEWSNELRNIGNSNGTTYLYRSYGAKTIIMPFYIKGSVKSKYDMLMTVLNVSEPKRLTFGNIVNRYFLALPDGKVEFEMLGENAGRGTITWLVPDGVSHSTDTKIATASVVDGILTANVNNNGSDDIWPVYRIENDKENGWHGIVHSGGVLEIGNREEADGQDYQQSETFLDTTTFAGNGWSNWSGAYTPDSRFDTSGTLAVSGTDRDRGLRLSATGNNTGLFNGGAIVYTLPADSEGEVGANNFYAYWESYFWAGRMGQTAIQDIVFWSDKEIVARWLILKDDKNGNTATARAFAGDGKGGVTQVYSRTFVSSNLDTENPFNRPRGSMDFLKEGANLRFYYWGQYPSIKVPAFANKKITKVSLALGNVDKRTGLNYVTNNAIRKFKVSKLKVDKWRDVPNRFGAGSEIVIDTETASIYVDGLPKNNEAVNPPIFAPLKIGSNKIEFYKSDWTQSNPTVTVEYKERWL